VDSPEALPIDSVREETNLFSTIPPFEVFGRLFDWSFLCAAAVTAGVLWFRRRIRD